MNFQIVEKPVIFKNNRGENLWGVLSFPAKKKKFPFLILAHGFAGTKSQPKFVQIGRKLAKEEIGVLRFDFSGCGDSEGDFKKLSIQQQVSDLKCAYEFLVKRSNVQKEKIGFLGYSLGAVAVSLFQVKNPVAKTLILLAPALNQKELIKIWYKKQEIEKWKRKKYLDTPKGRIGIRYLREAKDYSFIVSKIKVPTLILHGEKDEDLPLKFSEKIFSLLPSNLKKMVVIKGADHHFESDSAKREIIKIISKWLKVYL